MKRVLSLALGTLVAIVGSAAPALADPPGPTDYQSSVVAIVPETPGVAATMIGGDAFLQLEVAPSLHVVVLGYRGEPYVQFLPDGTVERNRVSPSTYLNEDRYAAAEIPADASYDAAPEWEVVATNGRWAWHDHRTHWMNSARPPGRVPGDEILELDVPIVVDGSDVRITVASVWLEAPSPLAGIVGALAGLAFVMGLALWLGRPRGATTAVAVVALLALGLGWWQVNSVPNETGPSALLYLLPGAALVLSAVGLVVWRSRMTTLGFAAAVPLALWGYIKWEGVVRAIVPTNAPWALDRAMTTAALVVGLVAGVLLLWAVSRGETGAGNAPATRRVTEEPVG